METARQVAVDLFRTFGEGQGALPEGWDPVAVRAGVPTEVAHEAREHMVRTVERRPPPDGKSVCILVKDNPDGWSTIALWSK